MILFKNISKQYLVHFIKISALFKNPNSINLSNSFINKKYSQKFSGKVRRLAISKFTSSNQMDDPKITAILEPLQSSLKEQVFILID